MAQTIVQVSGTDVSLFHVAERLLGDATQFYRILQINGLTDPMISGVMTLRIPAASAASTDGIPPQ